MCGGVRDVLNKTRVRSFAREIIGTVNASVYRTAISPTFYDLFTISLLSRILAPLVFIHPLSSLFFSFLSFFFFLRLFYPLDSMERKEKKRYIKHGREREREREFAVYSDVSPSRRFPAEKNKNVCAPAKAVHVARYAASDLESLPVNRAPPGEIAHGVQLTAIRLNTLLSYASLLRPFLFSE